MTDVNAALAEHQDKLAALEAQAAQLAATVTDFDDPKLAELDASIEQTKASIRRLQRFAQGQIVQHSTAQLAERRAAREKAYTDAVNLAKERIDLGTKIDAAFGKLGALLTQWAELGTACHRNAAHLHRDDNAPSWQYALLEAARGNNARFTGALEWALHKHQIGNVGVYLPWEQRRPLGDPYTVADAARHVAENLEIRLRDCLNQANERDI